jgi:hypothetical protein
MEKEKYACYSKKINELCHAEFEAHIPEIMRRYTFSDITLCSKSTNISEEYLASIFRVEEQNKQETNGKQVYHLQ